jgi:hypothetical protein
MLKIAGLIMLALVGLLSLPSLLYGLLGSSGDEDCLRRQQNDWTMQEIGRPKASGHCKRFG